MSAIAEVATANTTNVRMSGMTQHMTTTVTIMHVMQQQVHDPSLFLPYRCGDAPAGDC